MSRIDFCRAGTLLMALLLTVRPAVGEEVAAPPDSSRTESSKVVLPVLAYSPDTDLMFGAAFLRFFYLEDDRPGVRPSVFSPVLIYTSRSQTLTFLNLELNWNDGRDRVEVGGFYIRFPDQFYGIGRGAPVAAEEDYTPESLGYELKYMRRVVSSLRIGAGWRQMTHRLDDRELGGLLDTGGLRGTERTSLTLPGLTASWDTRDNTWAPTQGLYCSSAVRFSRDALASDYDFDEHFVDLRGYLRVGDSSVLAAQIAADWLTGQPPFFVLPRLGGEDGLRGYPGSRYLDAARVLGRVEYRSGKFWGRLSGVVFAGIGDVAPRLGDLSLAGRLWTAGTGLRFTLNEQERVNLRLDIGQGNDNSGFYLTLGEAF